MSGPQSHPNKTDNNENCDEILNEFVTKAQRKSDELDVKSKTSKRDDDKSIKSGKSPKNTHKHRVSCPCGVCPLTKEEDEAEHEDGDEICTYGVEGEKDEDGEVTEVPDDTEGMTEKVKSDEETLHEQVVEASEKSEIEDSNIGFAEMTSSAASLQAVSIVSLSDSTGYTEYVGGEYESDEDEGREDMSGKGGLGKGDEGKGDESKGGEGTGDEGGEGKGGEGKRGEGEGDEGKLGEDDGKPGKECTGAYEEEYSYKYEELNVMDGEEYIPPSTSFSIYSEHEGSFVEDYMKIVFEPYPCYKTLSSISSSYISCEETGLQRTIVIIKPQAVKFKETVYRVIFEAGIQIIGVRVVHLSPEQVSEIYSKHYGSPSFAYLVVSISEAPCIVISIAGINVIKNWLRITGPDGSLRAEWFYPLSMRKLFGLQPTYPDLIHGAENLQASNKENRLFYPNSIIEPITTDEEKVWDYCNLNINKLLNEACAEVVRKRPDDPIIFLADYLLLHNPFQPRFPENIAFSPT